MKLAAIQMVSTPDVQRNLQAAQRLVQQAAQAGAQLAVLPEYFCLLGQRETDKLAVAEAAGSGPIQQALAEMARSNHIALVAGSLPVRLPQDGPAAPATKVLNRSIVFNAQGLAVAHYDKLHLFAFATDKERYDEGRTLLAGQEPVAHRLALPGADELLLGLSICYDLRFPELYRTLMSSPLGPCDVLLVPSAFTHTTGQAHWELLLRARAVENQCYVVAAAQGGLHENGRRTWGHSLIVGPWGEVLACKTEEGEGVVLAEFDRTRLEQVRRQLPALQHRRAALAC